MFLRKINLETTLIKSLKDDDTKYENIDYETKEGAETISFAPLEFLRHYLLQQEIIQTFLCLLTLQFL